MVSEMMLNNRDIKSVVLGLVFLSASACVQAEAMRLSDNCFAVEEEIRHYEEVFSEDRYQKNIFMLGALRRVMERKDYVENFCRKAQEFGNFPNSLLVQEINQENGIYRSFILAWNGARNSWLLGDRFGAKKNISSEVLIREQFSMLKEIFSDQNKSKQIFVYDYVLDDSIYYLTYADADGVARKALYGAFEVDVNSLAEPWRQVINLLSDLNEIEQGVSGN